MRRGLLPVLPLVTLAVMLGPVLAGLWGTVLPAFGHFPAAGQTGPSLAPFAALADWPGLPRAVALSVTTGVGATVIALTIVMLLTAGWSGSRIAVRVDRFTFSAAIVAAVLLQQHLVRCCWNSVDLLPWNMSIVMSGQPPCWFWNNGCEPLPV